MLGDREKPGLYAAEQRRLIRQSIDREVLRFAPGWAERARSAGLTKPRTPADLAVLEPRRLEDLGRAATLLIRPSVNGLAKEGPGPMRRRVRMAQIRGRSAEIGPRIVDPVFKPIHWLIEREVPVGCSETDLARLAELGRRMLVFAGIGPGDAIVSVLPGGPNLGYWQLALGARDLGAPLAGLHPGTPADPVVLLGPTVLVGRPRDLHALLQTLPQSAKEAVTTLLAVSRSPMSHDQRGLLVGAAWPQTTLVEAWAPPGVRALWAQCLGGEGVHTWPTTELVEICDEDGQPVPDGTDGSIVWSGLGWRGTAVLRLATGLRGHLSAGPCPACRRTTPRLVPVGVEAVRPKRTVAPTSVRRIEPVPAPGLERPAPDGVATLALAEPLPPRRGPERVPVTRIEPDPVPVPVPEPVAVPEPEPLVEPEPVAVLEPDLPDVEEPDTAEPVEEVAWPGPVLAAADGLASWQAEHRVRRGEEELVVHLALADGIGLGDVLPALERSLGATQYVVVDKVAVEERIAVHGGRRVVDLRPGQNGAWGSAP